MIYLCLPVFQVALEVFGTRERILFDLDDYDTKLGILNGIAVPYFTGGSTNTAAALRAMREQIFTADRVRNTHRGYVSPTEGTCHPERVRITQRGCLSPTEGTCHPQRDTYHPHRVHIT